jgi:hypothetical protein
MQAQLIGVVDPEAEMKRRKDGSPIAYDKEYEC